MEIKLCRNCKSLKLKTEFNKNKTASDGLQKYCRDCTKRFSRQNKERKAMKAGRVMKPYQEQKFAAITDKELFSFLRKFTEENGRPPTTEDLENNPNYPCAYTYYRRFIYKATPSNKVDNWNAILHLAGIDIVNYFSLWRAWEYLVERTVQVFETNYIFQFGGISSEFRPDIVIPSKKLIIDASTSNYINKRKRNQFQYATKYGYKVQFWCLYQTTVNGLNKPNLKYVFADEIIERLKVFREFELIEKIKLIHNRHEKYQEEILTHKKSYYKMKLLEFVKEFDRSPTTKDFINNPNFPSTTSLCVAFGSFNKALNYAGIKTFQRRNNYE